MKDVVTYILKEDGADENFHLVLALSRFKDPEVAIRKLLALRNNTLLPGENPISLVSIRPKKKVCMEHAWKKVGDKYICVDCKIAGSRVNPMAPIRPVNKDKKYKDCSWKLKL